MNWWPIVDALIYGAIYAFLVLWIVVATRSERKWRARWAIGGLPHGLTNVRARLTLDNDECVSVEPVFRVHVDGRVEVGFYLPDSDEPAVMDVGSTMQLWIKNEPAEATMVSEMIDPEPNA